MSPGQRLTDGSGSSYNNPAQKCKLVFIPLLSLSSTLSCKPFYKTCESSNSQIPQLPSPRRASLALSLFTFCLPMSISHLLLDSVFFPLPPIPFLAFLRYSIMWTIMQSLELMSTKTVIIQNTLSYNRQLGAKLHGHITSLIKTKTLCIFFKGKTPEVSTNIYVSMGTWKYLFKISLFFIIL